MWDRTGENQVYVRQQKAAEEQLRFDKTEKPSRLASKDNGGSVPLCPPRSSFCTPVHRFAQSSDQNLIDGANGNHYLARQIEPGA
jgi:hypothetical protein